MSDYPGTGRLESELLAAYIDGELPPEARAKVEAEIAADPENYEWLVNVMAAVDAESIPGGGTKAASHGGEAYNGGQVDPGPLPTPVPEPVPKPDGGGTEKDQKIVPFYRRRSVVGAIGALAVAASVMLVVQLQPDWYLRIRGPQGDPAFAELVAAVGEERYIEARLTGGFKYGPMRQVMRGPNDLSKQNLRLLAVVGELQRGVTAGDGRVAATGVGLLLLGDSESAISLLEQALKHSRTGQNLSNLAAAYWARADQLGRSADLATALEVAGEATLVSPQLAEAWFNRAALLARFQLRSEAASAWEHYLLLDPHSPWAEEAKRQHALLRQPRVSATTPEALIQVAVTCENTDQDLQELREAVEDTLLPKWAKAYLEGDTASADRALSESRLLADCLERQNGDNLTAQVVKVVEESRSVARKELAEAHKLWATGRESYLRSDPASFGPIFSRARHVFTQRGSPMALWASHYEIAAEFFSRRLERVQSMTVGLFADTLSEKPSSLRARLYWNLGAVAFQEARMGDALANYSSASMMYEALREFDNAVSMHAAMAEVYGQLGLLDEAWREHFGALKRLGAIREYRRLHATITAPGYTAANSAMFFASAPFFAEALALASGAGNINYQFESSVGLGRALINQGSVNAARDLLGAARALEPQVSNPSLKSRLAGDLDMAVAEVAVAEGEPDAAVSATRAALARSDDADADYRRAELQLLLGRALRMAGRSGDALDEFARGAALFESKRSLLRERKQRSSYHERVWDLYGEAIGVAALDLNQPLKALEWLERGRLRSLPEISAERDPLRANYPSVIASDEGILCVATTARGVFSWLITSRGTTFAHSPNTSLDAAASRSALSSEVLIDLDRLLLEPFERELQGITKLIVVPDGLSQAVPFQALRASAQGQPRLVSTEIAIAPSASAARSYLSRVKTPIAKLSSVAVVAQSARRSRDSAPLPAVETEAEEVSEIYRRSKAFLNDAATFQSLVEAMNADVLHIASHAVADPRRPGSILLQLGFSTPSGSDSEWYEAFARLRKVPSVVVMAACQSARGPIVRGELALGPASPFLAAGVRDIVATLWDVSDEDTRRIVTALHRGLESGQRMAQALRSAQMEAIKSGMPHQSWGAFIAVVQ